MVKKYDELSVIEAFCVVLTDAEAECRSFFEAQWTMNREIARKCGVKDALYKDSVGLVREAIRRYRVKRWVYDNITDYLRHSAFIDRVSIGY